MSAFQISLFGRFQARCGGQVFDGLDACKAQELFCYLLLYRNRAHSRTALADVFWGDYTESSAKKYLRQALWQLQTVLNAQVEPMEERLLMVDAEFVSINPEVDCCLDVAVFEQAFSLVQDVPTQSLSAHQVMALRQAVQLYRADLLEGWYQDWCLYERERLQNSYLNMLGKLMSYYEARREYETALDYGERILRYDRAHERTHRQLMRLLYLAGDRTAALRQYERCVTALREELGVDPAKSTRALYEQICADWLGNPVGAAAPAALTSLPEVANQLQLLQSMVSDIQQRIWGQLPAAHQESL